MGDSFSPDFGQHVNPDGTITYDFTGHVHAQGLDLNAGDNDSPPHDRRVRWLRTSDGALVAEVYSFVETLQAAVILRASHPDGPGGDATLIAVQHPDGSGAIQAEANNSVSGSGLRTIIDDTGASSFLQLVTDADARLAYGTVDIGGFAGSAQNTGTETPDLGGRTPVLVLATAEPIAVSAGSFPTSAIAVSTTGYAADSFDWTAQILDGVSLDGAHFNYLAIA